jgi:predicted RNA-binding Zn-ribbon protein involved in translation (DUF1610 family)
MMFSEANMRRKRTDISTFDFTFPCTHCGYRIPPNELLRVDGEHVRCPKCGKDSDYGANKKVSFGLAPGTPTSPQEDLHPREK